MKLEDGTKVEQKSVSIDELRHLADLQKKLDSQDVRLDRLEHLIDNFIASTASQEPRTGPSKTDPPPRPSAHQMMAPTAPQRATAVSPKPEAVSRLAATVPTVRRPK